MGKKPTAKKLIKKQKTAEEVKTARHKEALTKIQEVLKEYHVGLIGVPEWAQVQGGGYILQCNQIAVVEAPKEEVKE